MSRSPYADDAIRIDEDTTPEEIHSFVDRRTRNPILIGESAVWNYSTHEPDMEELRKKVEEVGKDEFVIPFQVTGIWGYMQELLPREIREKSLLVYHEDLGEYKAFPNFLYFSSEMQDRRLRQHLLVWYHTEHQEGAP